MVEEGGFDLIVNPEYEARRSLAIKLYFNYTHEMSYQEVLDFVMTCEHRETIEKRFIVLLGVRGADVS